MARQLSEAYKAGTMGKDAVSPLTKALKDIVNALNNYDAVALRQAVSNFIP